MILRRLVVDFWYDFEFDLQNTIFVNYRNSIGRVQTKDLSEVVEENISDKKTGLVSYILFENNKISFIYSTY